MSFPKDLLDQATHLATREPKRPKQASLRRAVSSAYYAVFHLLVDSGARFLVRGNDRADLRLAVARAFDHSEMKSAANAFHGGTVPSVLERAVPGPIHPNLKFVCRAFLDLQQARHEADYDLTRVFTRGEVLNLVAMAEESFPRWKAVAGSPEGDAFLVMLLVREKLSRRLKS